MNHLSAGLLGLALIAVLDSMNAGNAGVAIDSNVHAPFSGAAIVRGKGDTTGVALVEAYALPDL